MAFLYIIHTDGIVRDFVFCCRSLTDRCARAMHDPFFHTTCCTSTAIHHPAISSRVPNAVRACTPTPVFFRAHRTLDKHLREFPYHRESSSSLYQNVEPSYVFAITHSPSFDIFSTMNTDCSPIPLLLSRILRLSIGSRNIGCLLISQRHHKLNPLFLWAGFATLLLSNGPG